MRPSILTVISLKMWSLHLLQTALRFGGNLKMVCGWCGNKFVECDWKGFTDSWVFIIIRWLLCPVITAFDRFTARSTNFSCTSYQKAVFHARPKNFAVLILRGPWGRVCRCWGGRGKAPYHLRSFFFHKNVASFILINPKWKGRIGPHHYYHLPSIKRKLNNSNINKH